MISKHAVVKSNEEVGKHVRHNVSRYLLPMDRYVVSSAGEK